MSGELIGRLLSIARKVTERRRHEMGESQDWTCIEDLDMFKNFEALADEVWDEVQSWNPFARDSVGKQLVRAVDSVGANLVEGDGRYHLKEKLNYCYIARGSVRETLYWLRRARRRRLSKPERLDQIQTRLEGTRRWINTPIGQRRRWIGSVREEAAVYEA